MWYLGRRANGDCGARDEWIAAHLTLDVLMWIALPRTETARTWADDPRQNAALTIKADTLAFGKVEADVAR